MKIKKICQQCWKEFFIIKHFEQKFCSRTCQVDSRKRIYQAVCQACGKLFYVRYLSYHYVSLYCSKKCEYSKISKKCLVCGKEYLCSRVTSSCSKYCSTACQMRLEYSRMKLRRSYIKKCPRCEIIFQTYRSVIKYCNSCLPLIRKNIMRERAIKSWRNNGIALKMARGLCKKIYHIKQDSPELNKLAKGMYLKINIRRSLNV